MPGVELSTSACNGHVVVALRGEMDIIGAADAEAAITALVVPGRCLIIDMSALDFIDCGSLGALLRLEWLARSTGGGRYGAAAPGRAAAVPSMAPLCFSFGCLVHVEARTRYPRHGGYSPQRWSAHDQAKDGVRAAGPRTIHVTCTRWRLVTSPYRPTARI